MSKAIDQRIVEMSFENHKFEKGIRESKNSLKEFSNALNHMGSKNDFGNIEKSVTSLSSSFSIMEQIGIGALRRIGDAAVSAGASLVKSLTIDQLTAGLSKYQEKIESVQTMTSAGYGLEEVEDTMEQLMWFADETSYSFSDMANNAGKFVAAGIDLRTSVKAMQGIATWAAHSGKNSEAASIAMFNLSQAISMGYVDTLNWRSIMNQNMNTVMFKEIAIGVAEATGAIKKGQVTIQNFDSNLKDKWFTNEVLLATLDQYGRYAEKVREVQEEMDFDTAAQAMRYMDANAQDYADVLNTIGNAAFKASQVSQSFSDSINATMDAVSTGWLRTYETIFGTLHEAQHFFSELTEILYIVFAASGDVRNEMLATIKEGGGIAKIFQSIKNVAVALLKPLQAISKAFDQFFPPKTAEQWLSIIDTIEQFTEKLIISDETADKIQRTFAGLFAVLDLGWQVVKVLGSGFLSLLGVFVPLNGGLLGLTARVGDFLVGLNALIKSTGVFQYSILAIQIAAILLRNALATIVGVVGKFVYELWTAEKPLEYLKDLFSRVFEGSVSTIKMVVHWIGEKLTGALAAAGDVANTKFGKTIIGIFTTIFDLLKEAVGFIGGNASEAFEYLSESIKNLDFSTITAFVVGGTLLMFVTQLSQLVEAMRRLATVAATFITNFSKKIFKAVNKYRDLALVIGTLTVSLYVLSKIPWNELIRGLTGIGGAMLIFVAAYGAVQAINVITSKKLDGAPMVKLSLELLSLAAGLGIFVIALKSISKLKGDVNTAIMQVGLLTAFVIAYQYLTAFISTKFPDHKKLEVKMTSMAIGLLALVGALKIVNKMEPQEITKGMSRVAGIMGMLIAIQTLFAVAARVSKGNKLSTSLWSISTSLMSMVVVLGILSKITISDMGKALKNVATLTGVLVAIELLFAVVTRVGSKIAKDSVRGKTGMGAIQMSLLGLVALVVILDKLDPSSKAIMNLTKLSAIIVGIELATAGAARLGGGAKVQKILGSIALTMMSFVVLIQMINKLTPEQISKGLKTITAFAGLIVALELVIALISRLYMFSNSKTGDWTQAGQSGAFTSIIATVGAILALTASLALLSILPQEELRQASISLAIVSTAIAALAVGIAVINKSLHGMSTSFAGILEMAKTIGIGVVAFVGLILAVKGIFAAVKSIGEVDWNAFGQFAIGMGMLTVLIAAFDRLLERKEAGDWLIGLQSLIPAFAAMAATILATMGMFLALNTVLPIVKNIDWGDGAKLIIGIGVVAALVAAMAYLAGPLSTLGAGIGPALTGVIAAIIGVGLIVGAFVGIAALFGLLENHKEHIFNGMDTMVEVNKYMGRVIGALYGGVAMEALSGIGEGLSIFADSIKDIKEIDPSGIKSLAEIFLILGATSMINSINRWMFFAKENPASEFVNSINTMLSGFANMDRAVVSQATHILKTLSPASEALGAFASAARDIPNTGGLVALFTGDNGLDKFGVAIGKFIETINNTGLSSTDAARVANILNQMAPAMDSLKKIAETARSIPNEGGILGAVFGENNLDDFGAQISQFLFLLGKISVEDTVIPVTQTLKELGKMAKDLKKFAVAAQSIPNSGGLLGDFFGENDTDMFADRISDMLDTFAAIQNNTLTDATTNLKTLATDMLPALTDFVTLAGNVSGVSNLFRGAYLENFGKELAAFVTSISNVDFKIVKPAMESLQGVTDSFGDIGNVSLENAIKAFKNNTPPFQAAIADTLNAAIKTIDSQKSVISAKFSSVFDTMLSDAKKYSKEFDSVGSSLTSGLLSGIKAGEKGLTTAMNKVTTNLVDTTKKGFQMASPSKIFTAIGEWIPKSLGKGINDSAKTVYSASNKMTTGIEKAVRDGLQVYSLSSLFAGIGKWIPTSLGEGIQNGKNSLLGLAKDLGIDTGMFTMNGLVDGLEDGEGGVTRTIKELLEQLLDPSSMVAGDIGHSLGDTMTEGLNASLSDPIKGLGGSKTKATVQSELQKIQAIIDDAKYYGQLSLTEELKYYEDLKMVKGQTAEDYKKIDREVYRVTKEIYEAQMKYIESVTEAEESAKVEREKLYRDYAKGVEKAQMEADSKLADLRNKREEDSHKASEDAQKKRLDKERKYQDDYNNILQRAEEERKRLREDYAKNQKSINDKLLQDIDAQNKAYEDAVKSRADTIYGAYSLFSEVPEDAEVTGEELLENLRNQGAALSEWQQSLEALEARGVGQGLIDELQKLGPSSKAQIKALLELTDAQMDEYVGLFQGKYTFARVKAETELEGLRISTQETIQDLTAQAAKDLKDLEYAFDDSMTNISDGVTKDLSALKKTYDEAMAEIEAELSSKLSDIERSFSDSSASVNKDLDNKLSELENTYTTSLDKVNKDLKDKLSELKNSYSTTMKDVKDLTVEEMRDLIKENEEKLKQLNIDVENYLTQTKDLYDVYGDRIVENFSSDMVDLNRETTGGMDRVRQTILNTLQSIVGEADVSGHNFAMGFANGINGGQSYVESAVTSLSRKAIALMEGELQEKSPSRVLYGIGKFFSLGFANGISDYTDDVLDASKVLANGPLAAFSKALAEMDDMIESGMDLEPVIKPVLDLSNVRSNGLSSLFGGGAISLSRSTNRLAQETNQNGNGLGASGVTEIHNHFDLRGMHVRSDQDIDLIATKLYQKQQNDLRGRGIRTIPAR